MFFSSQSWGPEAWHTRAVGWELLTSTGFQNAFLGCRAFPILAYSTFTFNKGDDSSNQTGKKCHPASKPLSARVWLISSPVEKGFELQPKDLFSTLITLWEWPPSTALLKPWLCHSPWAFSQAGVQHLRSAVSRGPWRCSPCWHYWVVKGNREAHLYTAPKTPGYFSVQQQTVDQLLVLLLSML